MLVQGNTLEQKQEMAIFATNYLKKHIMKKLFALLFVAAAFTFTSCGDASGNASEDATGTEESTDAPAEDVTVEDAPAMDATEDAAPAADAVVAE